MSFLPPFLFLLSLLSPYVAIICFRWLVTRNYRYYKYVNELMCTCTWLIWCLELQAMQNYLTTNAIIMQTLLFVLLMIFPRICNGAYANPCFLLVSYLQSHVNRHSAIMLLVMELLSVPISILVVYCIWSVISPYSISHKLVFSSDHSGFLFSSVPVGILLEAILTFISFIFIRVTEPTQYYRDLFNALYFITAGLIIGPFTGAFYNPLPITTLSIFFRKQSWAELAFVYWTGSAIGGVLAHYVLFGKSKMKIS